MGGPKRELTLEIKKRIIEGLEKEEYLYQIADALKISAILLKRFIQEDSEISQMYRGFQEREIIKKPKEEVAKNPREKGEDNSEKLFLKFLRIERLIKKGEIAVAIEEDSKVAHEYIQIREMRQKGELLEGTDKKTQSMVDACIKRVSLEERLKENEERLRLLERALRRGKSAITFQQNKDTYITSYEISDKVTQEYLRIRNIILIELKNKNMDRRELEEFCASKGTSDVSLYIVFSIMKEVQKEMKEEQKLQDAR